MKNSKHKPCIVLEDENGKFHYAVKIFTTQKEFIQYNNQLAKIDENNHLRAKIQLQKKQLKTHIANEEALIKIFKKLASTHPNCSLSPQIVLKYVTEILNKEGA